MRLRLAVLALALFVAEARPQRLFAETEAFRPIGHVIGDRVELFLPPDGRVPLVIERIASPEEIDAAKGATIELRHFEAGTADVQPRIWIDGGSPPGAASAALSSQRVNRFWLQLPVEKSRITGEVVIKVGAKPKVWKLDLLPSAADDIEGCRVAALLADTGYRDEALKDYRAILKNNAHSVCALEGLRTYAPSPTQTPSPTATLTPTFSVFSKVSALGQVGLVDEAWKKYGELIVNSPGEWGGGTEWKGWWYQPWGASRGVAIITEVLTAVLEALALALVGYILISGVRRWHASFRIVLDIGDLGTTPLGTPDRSISMVIEQALADLGSAGGLRETRIIDAPTGTPAEIPEITAVPREVPQIVNFLEKRVFAPRCISLEGTLLAHGERGAGIVARLKDGPDGSLRGSCTLWQDEFAPGVADDSVHLALAEPLAVWTYWRTLDTGGRRPTDDDLRRVFGTAEWQSYALFRRSVCMNRGGKTDLEEGLLRAALRYDWRNRHAIFNLAMILMRKSGEDGRAMARDHLQRVVELSESLFPKTPAVGGTGRGSPAQKVAAKVSKRHGENGSRRTDPTWVLAKYQLGIIELQNCIQAAGKAQHKTLAQACSLLDEAFNCAQPTGTDESRLNITIHLRSAMAVALAHAQLLKRPGDNSASKRIHEVEKEGYLGPRVEFNLACHYSDSTRVLPPKEKDWRLDRALAHLRQAIAERPDWADSIESDASLAPLVAGRSKEVDAIIDDAMGKKNPISETKSDGTNPTQPP